MGRDPQMSDTIAEATSLKASRTSCSGECPIDTDQRPDSAELYQPKLPPAFY